MFGLCSTEIVEMKCWQCFEAVRLSTFIFPKVGGAVMRLVDSKLAVYLLQSALFYMKKVEMQKRV